ncbi:MAG: hypothetical protein A3F11_01725 [Gammaproteobacteria bacterium RIFCSPHIGHO2_12_FULL_37_14]|nr:MAG: hypothetical protein A3F11_01725 [Gammaproteobacteria bacterium RIFCSPHIGHO2_12_FULL_37_14]
MKWLNSINIIDQDLKYIKKLVRDRFNINELENGINGTTADKIRHNIRILLLDIDRYLHLYPASLPCAKMLEDVHYLIHLYQVVSRQNSHQEINITGLYNAAEKVSRFSKSTKNKKAAEQLQEKLALYSDEHKILKQRSAPNQLHITIPAGYQRIGNKQGGLAFSGPAGGIYEYKADQQQKFGHKMLLKRETKNNKPLYAMVIAEFVGGAIIKAIAGDQAAKIDMMTTINNDTSSNLSADVYIGSQFFNDYTDLYKFAYWLQDKNIPKDRPKFAGSINRGPIQETVSSCVKKSEFATITSAMLFVSMFDMHSANMGFDGGRFVCLDFAASLYRLHKKIHPHSHLRFLPGFGPTNHFREYPHSMRITSEMADALEKAATINFQPIIINALDEIRKHYRDDAEPVKQFAAYLGINPNMKVNATSVYYNTIKKYLNERMEKRKSALQDFALQIRIDLTIEMKNGKHEINLPKLKELVEKNPTYFGSRLKDGYYHFRMQDHKSCYLARLFGLRITENHFAKMLNDAIKNKLQLDENLQNKLGLNRNKEFIPIIKPKNIVFYKKPKTLLDVLGEQVQDRLPPTSLFDRFLKRIC